MTPDDPGIQSSLAEVRRLVARANRLAVLTGAGISASSGIPTFRGGDQSLWSHYRPEDLATPEAFAADPELVWRWYDWRRGLIAAARPNAAHEALVRLERRLPVDIVTQNVDGFHQQAGSTRVHEFHGSIWRVRCTRCSHEQEDRTHPLPGIPRCPECTALMRPGVVWFGETIDRQVMARATRAVTSCDLLLVIGTAGLVHPASGLMDLARSAGAGVCEFNLVPGSLTPRVDLFIQGDAAETVPQIVP